MNQRQEDEGDLFGIRALEKGFYGGVPQSRPVTPVSITSSTIPPPRCAHVPNGQASEVGYLKPRHFATSTCSGRNGMPFVFPVVPTAIHQNNRSRSPSPTDSSHSQWSIPLGASARSSPVFGLQFPSHRPHSQVTPHSSEITPLELGTTIQPWCTQSPYIPRNVYTEAAYKNQNHPTKATPSSWIPLPRVIVEEYEDEVIQNHGKGKGALVRFQSIFLYFS